jgi:hypothetical protein
MLIPKAEKAVKANICDEYRTQKAPPNHGFCDGTKAYK